jgi:hypothetical protein
MRAGHITSALFASILALGLASTIPGYAAQSPQRSFRLAAGGNPAICKANYDQCVGACSGMSGCINQCAANYRGCLGQ